MLLIAFALHASSLVATASVTASAALEEQAFAAVEQQRFCEALDLFIAADRLAPNANLLMNAAQVAEAGGDRATSLRILQRIARTNAPDVDTRELKARVAALSLRYVREGPGTACAGHGAGNIGVIAGSPKALREALGERAIDVRACEESRFTPACARTAAEQASTSVDEIVGESVNERDDRATLMVRDATTGAVVFEATYDRRDDDARARAIRRAFDPSSDVDERASGTGQPAPDESLRSAGQGRGLLLYGTIASALASAGIVCTGLVLNDHYARSEQVAVDQKRTDAGNALPPSAEDPSGADWDPARYGGGADADALDPALHVAVLALRHRQAAEASATQRGIFGATVAMSAAAVIATATSVVVALDEE